MQLGVGEIVGNPLAQALEQAVRSHGEGDVVELEISGGEYKKELVFKVPTDHPEIQRLQGRYKSCVPAWTRANAQSLLARTACDLLERVYELFARQGLAWLCTVRRATRSRDAPPALAQHQPMSGIPRPQASHPRPPRVPTVHSHTPPDALQSGRP